MAHRARLILSSRRLIADSRLLIRQSQKRLTLVHLEGSLIRSAFWQRLRHALSERVPFGWFVTLRPITLRDRAVAEPFEDWIIRGDCAARMLTIACPTDITEDDDLPLAGFIAQLVDEGIDQVCGREAA